MLYQYLIWFISSLSLNLNFYYIYYFFYSIFLLCWFCSSVFYTKIQKIFFLTAVLFFFTFLNVWLYSDLIFLNLIDPLGLKFIVKDPQDYINFKLVWSIFLSNFCLILFFIIYMFFIFSGFVTIFFKSSLIYFIFVYIFYFVGIYFVVKQDLLFSSWPDITSLKFLEDIFVVFPDFSRVISTFISEFSRLVLFILNLLLLYSSQKIFIQKIILKRLNTHYKKKLNLGFTFLKKVLVLRFFLSFFIFESLFSFYGGENYLRDFFLFLSSFVCVEILTFTFIFFFQLKHWKGC